MTSVGANWVKHYPSLGPAPLMGSSSHIKNYTHCIIYSIDIDNKELFLTFFFPIKTQFQTKRCTCNRDVNPMKRFPVSDSVPKRISDQASISVYRFD
jgi:hypothetical protein